MLAPGDEPGALDATIEVESRVAQGLGGGELVLGRMGGVPVALVRGPSTKTAIRCARALAAEVLVVTRRVRALDPDAGGSELGAIADHLGFLVPNPLIGPNADDFGPRFPDLSAPYDAELRALARAEARGAGVELADGVYAGHVDPSRATSAEHALLHRLGADWLGRGGVPEVVVARHAGMRVLGLVSVPGAEARLDELTTRVVARLD